MPPFKISISNYRIFTDPITFIVDNGITAFVGPNNCGKSSLLRFFIEFRELWSFLSSDEILNYAKVNASRHINFQHVLDQEEVYNTRSSMDLEINVELLEDFSNATFTKVSCRFVPRGEVAPQLAELRRLGDEIAVVLDSERTSAGSSAKPERQKFLKEAAAQGIPCHLTELRAIENYFPDRAVKSVVPTLLGLSPFEEAPRAWAKQKSQNWKMATNMTIDEIKSNDIGKFLVNWMATRKSSK